MLTTKEFITKVKERGFAVTQSVARIEIDHIASVSKTTKNRIWFGSFNIETQEGVGLYQLILDYAQTPIDQREKRGYLWVKNMGRLGDNTIFYYEILNTIVLKGKIVSKSYTESEKEEIEKKTGIPLIWVEDV